MSKTVIQSRTVIRSRKDETTGKVAESSRLFKERQIEMEKKLNEEKASMFSSEIDKCSSMYPTEHGPVPTISPRENDNWAAMSTFCCETCMYYINFRCRRHSPVGQEGWSAVYNTDWCGDHKITKLKMALLKA